MFRLQLVSVSAVKFEPPTPRSRALARAAQQRERERAARKKERATRHRKHRERRSEEYRLRKQQGLSSPGTEEYSSSDEEEEEVRGRPSPIGGSLHPRHRSRLRWQGWHRLGLARRRPLSGIDPGY
jgi:hypothetical protein